MARQKGIIKLKGTIGDITFYKTKDGYIAREKGGIEPGRIASDPAFQRTRENGREFGRAGKAGKVLRNAVRTMLLGASDSRMVSRLTREMIRVIQADTVSIRGERNVIDGEAELLAGFEFNAGGILSTTLYAPYEAAIDREAGAISVNFQAFAPREMVNAPGGATHFRIRAAGAEVDFEAPSFVTAMAETAMLPLDGPAAAPIALDCAVTPQSTKVLFLLLGVEFCQQVNGQMYPLKNGAHNALAIARVSGL